MNIRQTFKVGDKFTLKDEDEGPPGKVYIVSAVYDHYSPGRKRKINRTGHPGFDPSLGYCLYEADGLPVVLYDFEMIPVQ